MAEELDIKDEDIRSFLEDIIAELGQMQRIGESRRHDRIKEMLRESFD